MKRQVVWVSTQDESVIVESADAAQALAEKFPTETKYRMFVQALVILDDVQAV